MKWKLFRLLFCVLHVVFLVGCSASNVQFPKGYLPWEVHVISPSFYPVMIDKVYGVNEKYDWTVFAGGYGHHTWSKSELERARKYFPNYDGFGIPLHIGVSTRGQQSGKKILPESVYVQWASLAEGKYYISKFDLTEDMRSEMRVRRPFTRLDGFESFCYENKIAFGLLPGGEAKVWRLGCNQFSFLGEVSPDKEFQEFGVNIDYYNIKQADTEQRAADNGVDLFPIPYDKVDKVFEYVPIPRCANKALWGCS